MRMRMGILYATALGLLTFPTTRICAEEPSDCAEWAKTFQQLVDVQKERGPINDEIQKIDVKIGEVEDQAKAAFAEAAPLEQQMASPDSPCATVPGTPIPNETFYTSAHVGPFGARNPEACEALIQKLGVWQLPVPHDAREISRSWDTKDGSIYFRIKDLGRQLRVLDDQKHPWQDKLSDIQNREKSILDHLEALEIKLGGKGLDKCPEMAKRYGFVGSPTDRAEDPEAVMNNLSGRDGSQGPAGTTPQAGSDDPHAQVPPAKSTSPSSASDASGQQPGAQAPATGSPVRAGQDYVIQSGDTLSDIAASLARQLTPPPDIWGPTGIVQSLTNFNCDTVNDPNLIFAGATLRIPKPEDFAPGKVLPCTKS